MPVVPIEQRQMVVMLPATRHGVPPALLAAFFQVESSWDPLRFRYEPGYRWLYAFKPVPPVSKATEVMQQMTSWGLGQVMGAVARERGFNEAYCSELLDPHIGAEFSARHIAHLMKRYAKIGDIASAYNDGDREEESDSDENKRYVGRVVAEYESLRSQGWPA